MDTCGGANQAALNISFRVYYHIVHKYELQDSHFEDLPQRLTSEQPTAFLMLQSVLLTDHWKRLDSVQLDRTRSQNRKNSSSSPWMRMDTRQRRWENAENILF